MLRLVRAPHTNEVRSLLIITHPVEELELRRLLGANDELLNGTSVYYNIWLNDQTRVGVVIPLNYNEVFTDIVNETQTVCPICQTADSRRWVNIKGCNHAAHYACLTSRGFFSCPCCEFDYTPGLTARVRHVVQMQRN